LAYRVRGAGFAGIFAVVGVGPAVGLLSEPDALEVPETGCTFCTERCSFLALTDYLDVLVACGGEWLLLTTND